MIVSGLPEKNGNRHAIEIANCALDLKNAVQNKFRIPHLRDEKLHIRIGLHTGTRPFSLTYHGMAHGITRFVSFPSIKGLYIQMCFLLMCSFSEWKVPVQLVLWDWRCRGTVCLAILSTRLHEWNQREKVCHKFVLYWTRRNKKKNSKNLSLRNVRLDLQRWRFTSARTPRRHWLSLACITQHVAGRLRWKEKEPWPRIGWMESGMKTNQKPDMDFSVIFAHFQFNDSHLNFPVMMCSVLHLHGRSFTKNKGIMKTVWSQHLRLWLWKMSAIVWCVWTYLHLE